MSVSVQEGDFDVGCELAALTSQTLDAGAIVTFTGLVRKGSEGVEHMTLEHYPGMTEAALEKIEAEAHQRWPLLASRIVHRTGKLKPGDQIVLVATASAHRAAAFEAAEFLMDYLKTRAPFWKQEATDSGANWVEARTSDDASAQRWLRGKGMEF